MDNVSHQTNCNQGKVQVHVYPPPMPLIKGKNNEKMDKGFVKTKLNRYPMSKNLEFYELKNGLV